MAENVEIKRKIYGKTSFENVVNTSFSQLIPSEDETTEEELRDVEQFFQDYDRLFFDIPASGSENSHLALVERSSDYIGISINDLREEIDNLREENIALKNQLFVLSQNI